MTVIALDYARSRRRRWPFVLAILLSLGGAAAVAGVKGPEWRHRYAVWVAQRQAVADGRAAAEADWEGGDPAFMEVGMLGICGGIIQEGVATLSYDEKTGLPLRTHGSATGSFIDFTDSYRCDALYVDAYNKRVAELQAKHGPPPNYIAHPRRLSNSVVDLVAAAEWTPLAPADVPEFVFRVDDEDSVSTAPVPGDPRLRMYRVSRIIEACGGLLVHTHFIYLEATGNHVVTLH